MKDDGGGKNKGDDMVVEHQMPVATFNRAVAREINQILI